MRRSATRVADRHARLERLRSHAIAGVVGGTGAARRGRHRENSSQIARDLGVFSLLLTGTRVANVNEDVIDDRNGFLVP